MRVSGSCDQKNILILIRRAYLGSIKNYLRFMWSPKAHFSSTTKSGPLLLKP